VLRSSIARAKPGITPRDWKRAAQVEMTGELVALGLLSKDEAAKDTPDAPACKKYLMHGLGHSLGWACMISARQRPVRAGLGDHGGAGIYIPEEGIGIRLENDILITVDSAIDLRADVPIEPDAIERLMK